MKKYLSVLMCLILICTAIHIPIVEAATADDLIRIAEGELHNTNGNKYGSGSWCGHFIVWCANKANIPTNILPRLTKVSTYIAHANYRIRQNHSPKRGDIVILDTDSNGTANHVEIVTGIHSNGVYTIGGNTTINCDVPQKGSLGVETKTRKNSMIVGYLVVNYDSSTPSTPEEPETEIVDSPTLSVQAGTTGSNTIFTWNAVEGASSYDLKIWKGTLWEGSAYAIYNKDLNETSHSLNLPVGYYEAYVDANNAFGTKMSNVVKFTVTPSKPKIQNEKKYYSVNKDVVIKWDEVVDATHYNAYLYKKNLAGDYEFYTRIMNSTEEEWSVNVPVGEYHAMIQAYNNNYWNVDYSDWIYTQSDNFYFTVIPYEDIGDNVYATIFHNQSWKPITVNSENFLCLGNEEGYWGERWKFIRQTDGSYMIQSANGKYLEINGGYSSQGQRLVIADYNGNPSQKWYLKICTNNTMLIESQQGRVIDLYGNNAAQGIINMWENDGDNVAQEWVIYSRDTDFAVEPALNVSSNTSQNSVVFNWNSGCYQTDFVLKIWKGTLWEGSAYAIYNKDLNETSHSLNLPVGYYEAYIDANNAFGTKMSNVVKFTVTPSKPKIQNEKKYYSVNKDVVIKWDEVRDATHYNAYLYKKNLAGDYEFYTRIMNSTEEEWCVNVPVGEYYSMIQAYNNNYWNVDHSDWIYIQSDNFYFTVTEKSFTTTTINNNIFNIECNNIENGNLIILALYKDKRFVKLYNKTYEGEDIAFAVTEDYDEAKMLVWKSVSNMIPITCPEIIRK